jgi:hypothetical protein
MKTEPKITKNFIEVDNGGVTHIIFRKHIRLITSNTERSISCSVYVVNSDEPITIPLSLNSLKIQMGLFEEYPDRSDIHNR